MKLFINAYLDYTLFMEKGCDEDNKDECSDWWCYTELSKHEFNVCKLEL